MPTLRTLSTDAEPAYKPDNKRGPIMPHTVPDGPWQKMGTNYFDFNGKKFLLVIDYFSKFMYVEEM